MAKRAELPWTWRVDVDPASGERATVILDADGTVIARDVTVAATLAGSAS